MNNNLEERWKEAKKKIFPEEPNKMGPKNRSSIEGRSGRQLAYNPSNANLNVADDLKRQLEDLVRGNQELKVLLK